VQIFYGGDAPTPSSIYFAKWMESALPEARVELKHGAEGTRSLRSIVLSGASEVMITRPDKATLEVHAGGRVRRSTARLLSEETLMSEELSILGPDPVFDKVLA
jgi:hypothetical protein